MILFQKFSRSPKPHTLKRQSTKTSPVCAATIAAEQCLAARNEVCFSHYMAVGTRGWDSEIFTMIQLMRDPWEEG